MLYEVKLEQRWKSSIDQEENARIFVSHVEWSDEEDISSVVRLAIEDFYEEGMAIYEEGELKVISVKQIQEKTHTEKQSRDFGKWYKPQFYFRTQDKITADPILINPFIKDFEKLQKESLPQVCTESSIFTGTLLKEEADVVYETVNSNLPLSNIYKKIKNRFENDEGTYYTNRQVTFDLNNCKVMICEPHTNKVIFANFELESNTKNNYTI